MSDNDAAPEKAKFLEQALAADVASFDSRRLTNKNKAFLSKILSISFSTLTTILLGWQAYRIKP